ncbi:MAG TPA: metal-dependent hydrolase [Candidatus Polarisedimenticolia bacterium]|nr:metal-dependent hydrolase [Candidatus Polarisedimenticolia bacterium]
MDPVTHGITGALLGKGFFSKRQARVAVFAATLGAVAPDVDVFREAFSNDPLAIVKYHRGVTHSFLALPFFALLLAFLTIGAILLLKRWSARWRDLESPPWAMLTLIYGVGIASHIILDGMTSFGTRIWDPLSQERVAWDLLFIVDFTFTSIVLLPQVGAWIYRDPAKSLRRAVRMWVIFTAGALLVWAAARAASYPFHLSTAAIAIAVLAGVCFAPAVRGAGFRISRSTWCRAGTYVAIVYLSACGLAHHTAMLRVKAFADQHHIVVERMGALPTPPSFLDWGGAIRAPDGLYEAHFDLRDSKPPAFRFIPDSPPDSFTARALRLPEVELYWQFARFPSIVSFSEDGHHMVEFGENRFMDRSRRSPQPFTYQLVFDPDGTLVAEGWLTSGMMRQQMRRISPQLGDAAGSAKSSP